MESGVLQSLHGIHYYQEPCLFGVPFRFKARNEELGQVQRTSSPSVHHGFPVSRL